MKQLIQRYPITSEVASFFFLLFMLLLTSMAADQLMGQREAARLLHETMELFGRYHVFSLVVFGPWLETLLCQALPAVIGQVYIRQPLWRWLIVVVPFGLGHYESSAVLGSLFNGLGGGIILGYVYLKYMQRSHYRAILVTWMLHASANACILLSS